MADERTIAGYLRHLAKHDCADHEHHLIEAASLLERVAHDVMMNRGHVKDRVLRRELVRISVRSTAAFDEFDHMTSYEPSDGGQCSQQLTQSAEPLSGAKGNESEDQAGKDDERK